MWRPPLGRANSAPPGYFAGNMDNKWLVAGTKIYIPVHVPGALFSVGDGHAAQGDGEVCVTAIETNLTGVFRFTVRKNRKLRWPRAETPTQLHHHGPQRRPERGRAPGHQGNDRLPRCPSGGSSRDDAYMLTSAAVDLHVTQVVDGVKGVHATLPKAIFEADR